MILRLSLLSFVFFIAFCPLLAAADSPFAETAVDFSQWVPTSPPDDAISLEARRNDAVVVWAVAAFGGKKEATRPQSTVQVQVERQDHGTLNLGQSCIATPLHIGSKHFQHGLGTHSTSILRFSFAVDVKKFETEIGIDNNSNTRGESGMVSFAVEANEKELYRSGICKGGEESVKVSVDLPTGTRELVLKVDDGGDGTGFDHADWANARITTSSGEVLYLDDVKMPVIGEGIPFSFKYGGVSSAELLPHWSFTETSRKLPDRTQSEYRWLDPKTGLAVTAVVEVFDRYPAVDWLLYFENTSDQETPLLENVAAVDAVFHATDNQKPVRIHTLTGDSCDKYSWLTAKHDLSPSGMKTFQPNGGRSSSGAFPFWNLQIGDDASKSDGVFIALGWTGQWKATFQRDEDGRTKFSAGMERLSTVLMPKEKIRSPRILLMPWDGDRRLSHILFRRLLMEHYVPKRPDGRPVQIPIAGQNFNRYAFRRAGWEAMVAEAGFIDKIHQAGCDTFWYDAAWFPGGFPNGVGSWFSEPKIFPNGVKALGDLVHRRNMRFILWFEPERVAKGSQIAEEYPQYVFGGKDGGLYKLGDPQAREFLTRLIGDRIEEYGVDIFRVDFNIDPLSFWRNNDALNRQGMTEIRYVEGHYAMWDAILERFPGIWIDNCASGGRRIDLETTKRSVQIWRSDTCCGPNQENLDQNQQLGLMQYLPLISGNTWSSDPYIARSVAGVGLVTEYNYLEPEYQEKQARDSVLEARINQKIWYGDFYPMTETDPNFSLMADHVPRREMNIKLSDAELSGWTAYQVHRADLNAGLAVFFRRDTSPYASFQASLRNIDPDAAYQVEVRPDYVNVKTLNMKGSDLQNYEAKLPEKRSSLMLRYWKH